MILLCSTNLCSLCIVKRADVLQVPCRCASVRTGCSLAGCGKIKPLLSVPFVNAENFSLTIAKGSCIVVCIAVKAGTVAVCRATQQALLTAPWPTELIGHHRSSIRTSTKTIDSAERAVHLAASEVLFRGLRVRMGIGTGLIEKMQVHCRPSKHAT